MNDYDPNKNQGAGNANQGGDGNNSQGNNNQGDNKGGNQNNGSGAGQGNQNANQNQNAGGNQGGGEDYKTKFSESTKEAQRLLDVLKANGIDPKTGKKADAGNNNAGGQGNNNGANDQQFFTDADLEAAFPSFSTMGDDEKAILRQVGSLPKMARMVAEMYDKTTFIEQLEVLKADPANKLISENEKEFKEYAYKDGNLKLPIEVLADAFIGKKLREGAGNGANNNNNGGGQGNQGRQGMENGSAGAGAGNDSGIVELTPDQAREMRQKDPKKYAKLAATKKLKIVTN